MDDASLTDPKPHDPASDPPVETPGPPPETFAARAAPFGREARARLAFDVARLPETTGAWLHVVSGPTASATIRGALEIAARLLSGGHRVLLIDGSPRLRLHDRFDRDTRWGVIESLSGEMPALGLVQDVGRPELFLLAHGLPAPRTDWARVGSLLDEVRPHFGRAILALDAAAPAAIGAALAGWHLEGWWTERGRARRRASLSDRLGIFLSELDVEALSDVRLEALDARLSALSTSGADAGIPSSHALAPGSETPAGGSANASTLTCDPQVRERLRFLLWMRHVQREGRVRDAAPTTMAVTVSSAPAATGA